MANGTWSTIGSTAGSYFGPWGTVAGGAIGGLLDSFGGGGNDLDAQIALYRENRDWMENQANTAHWREVRDLKSAGLNPMLSFHGSGAASPASSAPQVQNYSAQDVTAGASSATAAAGVIRTLQEVTESQARIAQARAVTDEVRGRTLDQSVTTAAQAADLRQKGLNIDLSEIEKWIRDGVKAWTAKGLMAEGDIKEFEARAAEKTFSADVERRKAESEAAQLEIPKMKAEADFWKSDFGELTPYIKGLLGIFSSGASSAAAVRRAATGPVTKTIRDRGTTEYVR